MPEVTLDATLGLGRVCEDQLDVELTQGLANNGLGTLGVALFERDRRDRPGPLAKVARLVGVEGDGTAMAAQVVDGDLPVGCSRVAWDETGHHELVRGIVMHLNEHEAASSAVLEPGVLGAVPLDELAEGRPARSGLAMPRPPALRPSRPPSSIIHLRRVPAFSGPISASRDRCSASSVGPKPSNTGSRARFNARPRICDALTRFERQPRSPWITTPSPARSHLLRSLRKWREVMPSNSAPRLAATSPCSTCFSTASRSRSRWLNVSISSPGSVCSLHSERTNSERGHFYFNQTGHFYFNATCGTYDP